MKKPLSAADQYRKNIATRDEIIVDVTLPSGNIFQFAKLPSVFKTAFELGVLPSGGTDGAVGKWIDEGIIQAGELTPDQTALANEGLRIMNLVLTHSRVPKLVAGPAVNEGELSTSELSDDDIEYLVKWAKAGGDTSLMLNTFPVGPGPDAVAQPNRQERRAAAKRAA